MEDTSSSASSSAVPPSDASALESWLREEGNAPKTTLPDELVAHYLRSAGCPADDPAVVQLVAIAAQKFLAGVLEDAKSCELMRAGAVGGGARAKRARGDSGAAGATGADRLTVAGLKQRCVACANPGCAAARLAMAPLSRLGVERLRSPMARLAARSPCAWSHPPTCSLLLFRLLFSSLRKHNSLGREGVFISQPPTFVPREGEQRNGD